MLPLVLVPLPASLKAGWGRGGVGLGLLVAAPAFPPPPPDLGGTLNGRPALLCSSSPLLLSRLGKLGNVLSSESCFMRSSDTKRCGTYTGRAGVGELEY